MSLLTARNAKLAAGVVTLAVAASVSARLFLTSPPEDTTPPTLTLDMAGVHPRIAAAVKQSYEQVIQQPASAASWGDLGMLLMAHQMREQAAGCFLEAIRLDPKEFRWPYYLAYLREETDMADAAHWYGRALEVDPSFAYARIRLGNAFLKLAQTEHAKEQFKWVAIRQPDSPHAQMGLARVALAEENFQLARQHFEAAAVLPGWYPRSAYVELVRVNTRLGDTEGANEAKQQVARMPETATVELIDPLIQEIEAKDVMARAFAMQADQFAASGNWSAAEKAYRQLIQARPDMPTPALNLANALSMQGRFDQAAIVLEAVTERFPNDVVGHFQLGLVLHSTGENQRAVEAFQLCTKLKPDFAEAWYNLGLVWIAVKEVEAAASALKQAVDTNPRHAAAHLALGVLLYKGMARDEALRHFQAAVDLSPGDPVPLSYLEKARSGAKIDFPNNDSPPASEIEK